MSDNLITSERFHSQKCQFSCQLSVDLKTGFNLVSDYLLTSYRFPPYNHLNQKEFPNLIPVVQQSLFKENLWEYAVLRT